ncbi:MAG: SAM-dependent chlorinase/fluorinase [Candidatus Sumerlaeaceae bacterium]|nr:SAM-dependent chlorinase/fluorinase [Candidatus Sumerlaeaceae bacterium]
MNRFLLAILITLAAATGWSRPVVALMTDFGLANEAVGQCHGAILAVNSDIEVVDLCHNVDSYDIQLAAIILRGTKSFPKGTAFVAVIDPGVGTSRRAVGFKTNLGYYYIGPDNGIFSGVIKDQGVAEAVTLSPKLINPNWAPGTFDGRDLFSPAAAKLVSSNGNLATIGDKFDPAQLVTVCFEGAAISNGVIQGIFQRTDEPYGNLWTNITRDDLTSAGLKIGDTFVIEIGRTKVEAPFVVSFGAVDKGKPLAYICSSGSLAFAINQGNFVNHYKLAPGAKLSVKAGRRPQ